MKATRKSRFSLGMKIACILSCLTLFTMGFASWWIVKIENAPVQNGSFAVYDVSEKEVKVEVSSLEGAIVFGTPTEAVTSKWLIADSIATEDLTATLVFTVKTDGSVKLNQLLSKVSVNMATNTALNAALGTYVTAPVISGSYVVTDAEGTATGTDVSITNATYTAANGAAVEFDAPDAAYIKVTLNVTFDWGTAFGGMNPYKYYNQFEYDAQTGGEYYRVLAKNALGELAKLDDASNQYSLTITAISR